MKQILALMAAMMIAAPVMAQDRSGPLRIEITEGVIEPVPIAVAPFIAENATAAEFAREITAVVAADLSGTGLFRDIPKSAYISQVAGFDDPVAYADWKAINAEALVVGAVTLSSDNTLLAKFRLFDIFRGSASSGIVSIVSTAPHPDRARSGYRHWFEPKTDR